MKLFASAGLALLVALAAASPRSIIAQKEQDSLASIKNKNPNWFVANMTDDYTDVGPKKTATKAESIAQVKLLIANLQLLKTAQIQIVSFSMQGKTALVVTKTHIVAILKGQSGKAPVIEVTDESKEFWVPVGNSYKLHKTVDISDKTLINGKPFNM
jgi:glucose/arabinose dehydrogenase